MFDYRYVSVLDEEDQWYDGKLTYTGEGCPWKASLRKWLMSWYHEWSNEAKVHQKTNVWDGCWITHWIDRKTEWTSSEHQESREADGRNTSGPIATPAQWCCHWGQQLNLFVLCLFVTNSRFKVQDGNTQKYKLGSDVKEESGSSFIDPHDESSQN